MVQVPAATIVTVEPETVQTPVVEELNVTASEDEDVAETANAASLNVLLANVLKVMVCAPVVTVKDCGTWAAAAKLVFPA
jgi:hypothetical protein